MPRRICAADTVIYLDLPTLQCLRGVVGRYLFTEAREKRVRVVVGDRIRFGF